ncbi:MAG: sortase [Chloroflexi bacterium]|nr:sortase [Chloroflexota bacterium]
MVQEPRSLRQGQLAAQRTPPFDKLRTPPGEQSSQDRRLGRRRFLVTLAALAGMALPLLAKTRAEGGWDVVAAERSDGQGMETPQTDISSSLAPAQATIPVPAAAERAPKLLPPVRLAIPAIQLESPVVPLGVRFDYRGQLEWETAPFVVGHYVNTANPGGSGNCVLSGHISSRSAGAVFKRLPEVQPGDGVAVATVESLFLYQVVSTQVVDPRATEVMGPVRDAQLTLLTCVPDGVYSHRLVVSAILL